MTPIRVAVADDHPLVREGFKRIISSESDFALAGEAASGDEALAICAGTPVDVLLLDITMPGPGFFEVLERIARRGKPAVLVVSMHDESKYALRALRDGAKGYLTKGQSPRVIAAAIRAVADGGTYVSPTIATNMVAEITGERSGGLESLSRREFQVLAKLGVGKSAAEIASELALSPKTIATYRARLLQKLGLRRTADLIRYAVEEDLAD